GQTCSVDRDPFARTGADDDREVWRTLEFAGERAQIRSSVQPDGVSGQGGTLLRERRGEIQRPVNRPVAIGETVRSDMQFPTLVSNRWRFDRHMDSGAAVSNPLAGQRHARDHFYDDESGGDEA